MADLVVIGAGLAGTECAWQLAERGVSVRLIEQKPRSRTPAQHSDHMAELVCSNSFRGAALHNAVGLLKEEMRRAGSLLMEVGTIHQVPAGGAFAVDRASCEPGPVLLIDDTADSRWTLTEVGRGLRRSGVVAVWPLVLASTAVGG